MTKGIIGAIIGDIAGSTREFDSVATTRFKLFTAQSSFTDDSVLTIAIAEWMLNRESTTLEQTLLKWGRLYPNAKYGRGFKVFIKTGRRNPQGSTHNGSAMRVSPVGFLASSFDEALALARESALPTHDTPGAIKGAQAIAVAVWMARNGYSKAEIREKLEASFGFDLSEGYDVVRDRVQTLLEMRSTDRDYANEQLMAAETTVPMALTAFFAAESYEEAIKLAIYLGGDSDTIACMAGAVASAFWGVPDELAGAAIRYLPSEMIEIVNAIDGTSWEPTGISPQNTLRWSINDVVVYGSNEEDTEGEQGFYDVRPTRLHRHFNAGYQIVTIGRSLQQIEDQIVTLEMKTRAYPDKRYIVRELGIGKAGYCIEQIAPLFRWALGQKNVLLPESFVHCLKNS